MILLLLKKNEATVISEKISNHRVGGKPADVLAILEYQGIKIGISSKGDPGIEQDKILNIFIKNNCRIILCACRTQGLTKKPLDTLRNTWDIRFVYPAEYRFISIDTLWNELMLAIRLIKLTNVNLHDR